MPGTRLPFLEAAHPVYAQWQSSWERDEKRLYGGDAVLPELVRFGAVAEGEDSFNLRKATARYTNFPDLHLTTLVGHISREGPEYSFGALGPVREREEIKGDPGLHELFFYNCDGIGADGSQYPAWRDGVKRRAGATGVRWVMAEMPSIDDLREIRRRLAPPGVAIPDDDAQVTGAEQREGYRVFLKEYSPLDVHNWKYSRGVLQWAVIWIPLDRENDLDDMNDMLPPLVGRYLLVRKGYAGLGQQFEEGGWWTFDEDHAEIDHIAGWEDTNGEIPLWRMFAVKDEGTARQPAMGRSLIMELGQISIDLMNARSEQRYNLRQAAKTINYFLGMGPEQHAILLQQLNDQSIAVAVPPVMMADGTVGIPSIWNSSQAAIDAQAFQIVMDSGMAEAREVMVKQVTSGLQASGEKVKASFEEATSPLLATLAETSEEFDNTMLFFVLQLMHEAPTASVTYPREFPLRDVVDELTGLLDLIKQAGLSSPTLEVKAVDLRATELGLMDDEAEAKKIRGELADSAKAREDRKDQEASMFGTLAGRPGKPPGAPPTPPATPPGE